MDKCWFYKETGLNTTLVHCDLNKGIPENIDATVKRTKEGKWRWFLTSYTHTGIESTVEQARAAAIVALKEKAKGEKK